MALPSTLYRCNLALSDTDRHHYLTTRLQLALHPSETPERMLARLLAWCLFHDEELVFCKGISDQEEPDLWIRTLDDRLKLWIEVGEPEPDRIRKACLKAEAVVVCSFTTKQQVWWGKNRREFAKYSKARFFQMDTDALTQLAENLPRSFHWQVTLTDGQLYIHDDRDHLVSTTLTEHDPAATPI